MRILLGQFLEVWLILRVGLTLRVFISSLVLPLSSNSDLVGQYGQFFSVFIPVSKRLFYFPQPGLNRKFGAIP